MKKIEMIWRELLETAPDQPIFEQQTLARRHSMSTSTVFSALSPLRAIGAVTVTGRNFRVTNLSKILLFWATHRNLEKDIIYHTFVDAPVLEIEGLVDNKTIFGAYTAARMLLGSAPADYEKVYLYARSPEALQQRFPTSTKTPNVFVLLADPFLPRFGKMTPPSQTYVDCWNLKEWYAQEFLSALKDKYYGFLP